MLWSKLSVKSADELRLDVTNSNFAIINKLYVQTALNYECCQIIVIQRRQFYALCALRVKVQPSILEFS